MTDHRRLLNPPGTIECADDRLERAAPCGEPDVEADPEVAAWYAQQCQLAGRRRAVARYVAGRPWATLREIIKHA